MNISEQHVLAGKKLAKRTGGVVFLFLRYFLLVGLSFLILYPLLYLISISFRPVVELFDETIIWIPKNPTLIHYDAAMELLNYGTVLLRTVLVIGTCTVLQLCSCSLAAYGLARFKFKGVGIFFLLTIFTLIVLPQTAHISLFTTFR